MVGQNRLKNQILELNKYSQFSILVGPRGSGKKEMAKWIGNSYLKLPVIFIENKIDSIRELIETAHTINSKTVYVIPNGDTMTNAAKNSLLKISEEPPANIYIILLLRDLNNTLPTIRSRATIYTLDLYSNKDLTEYTTSNNLNISNEIINSCDNINDLLIYNQDITIWEFVDKVIRNIDKVSISNCFKIGNNLSLKKESEGYDLELFWKVFCYKCYTKITEDNLKYSPAVIITSKYLSKITNPNFNKVFLFDNWVLHIRKIWGVDDGC